MRSVHSPPAIPQIIFTPLSQQLRGWSVPIPLTNSRARICKRLRRPAIDSEESTSPGWESIPGLLKRFKNTGSGYFTSLLLCSHTPLCYKEAQYTPLLFSVFCKASASACYNKCNNLKTNKEFNNIQSKVVMKCIT